MHHCRRPRRAERPAQPQERRRGDALVDLARRAIAAGDLPAEGGLDTTVVVSTSLEKLRGELVEAEPTLDSGIELPVESVRRLACNTMVLAAVLATTSQPLDIGRASRLVPVGIRRALILRDKRSPSPAAKSPQAGVTHITWCTGQMVDRPRWTICACSTAHHRLIHHSEWEVAINPDGLPAFIAPAWVTPEIATADSTWRITSKNDTPENLPPPDGGGPSDTNITRP